VIAAAVCQFVLAYAIVRVEKRVERLERELGLDLIRRK
jgi:hypothetical protein